MIATPRTPTLLLAAALLAGCAAGARAQSGVRRPPTRAPAGGGVTAAQQAPDEETLAAERECAEGESHAAAGRDAEALAAFGRGLKLYFSVYEKGRPPAPVEGSGAAQAAAAFREATGARLRRAPECVEGYLRVARGVTAFEREQMDALRGQALMLRETDESRAVFLMAEVDERARINYKPEPGFTEEARRNHVRGTVRVRAVLGSDGVVRHVLVLRGLPHGLSEEGVKAARRMRFTPAVRNGRPVSQFVMLEYGFETF